MIIEFTVDLTDDLVKRDIVDPAQIISTICDDIQKNPRIVQFVINKLLVYLRSPVQSEAKVLLTILETVVKKHKNLVQNEIVKELNCEIFAKLIITTPHEEVREKMMSLIQLWAFLLKEPPKYCALEVSFIDS
jgi:hypothetical protein